MKADQGLDTLLFSLVATWKQSVDLSMPQASTAVQMCRQ